MSCRCNRCVANFSKRHPYQELFKWDLHFLPCAVPQPGHDAHAVLVDDGGPEGFPFGHRVDELRGVKSQFGAVLVVADF